MGIFYFLVLPSIISTGYAFHGNATEDALLKSPGATSPSTSLDCEKGNSNEVIPNIIESSKARATFQCTTNSTIAFSFEEDDRFSL